MSAADVIEGKGIAATSAGAPGGQPFFGGREPLTKRAPLEGSIIATAIATTERGFALA